MFAVLYLAEGKHNSAESGRNEPESGNPVQGIYSPADFYIEPEFYPERKESISTMNPGYKPEIKKQVDSGNVYYIVNWSGLRKADKYEIIRSVPSVSGIFELYYMDGKKKLNLFYVSKAWYGGLRNTIRKLTDPELVRNPARHKVLSDYDCYYRFSLTDSYADMSDIIFFFARTYFPPAVKAEHSGRYIDIFVDEHSPDKIVTI